MKRTTNNEQRTTDTERKRWRQAQELLDALEELPPDEHQAYLDRACPDAGIREEVLAMLAVEEEAGAYLDRFASGFRPLPEGAQDLSGRRIGVYRLLKPIGRGGMGVVYEAERADGTFEQKVALKLLTTALAGTEAHQRFLAERRILAGLEHPAIARILDGGVTEDGTPWFAMEHVEGLPIDEYCDRHRLGIRERLELFLQVCDAVEHAHHRLVVHRDLKPTNILVTRRSPGKVEDRTREQDDATSPTALRSQHRYKQRTTIKLLDFGIAKLLEADESGAPTRTSLRLMTPEYASPEQVRGQEVTTASDVYQLGLLLYELLTGHRPYVFKRRNSAGELERVICEQPPTRLSAAITREGTYHQPDRTTHNEQRTTAFICQARRTSPSRLRRRLRGDLENIAGKALSKEPQRRYGSADRLAQDIRRHLSGLPVTARADTWMYRGRKFVQRHAIGVAAMAGVVVLTGVLAGYHFTRVQDERDVAQAERDRADMEALKARQVSDFLVGLFHSADPREARAAEISARELLDRGVLRVNSELAMQPEIKIELLHALGQTYRGMGVFESAEDMFSQALELQDQQPTPAYVRRAWVMTDLGLMHYQMGSYQQAQPILDEAIDILETRSTPGTEDRLAHALLVRGENNSRMGRHDQALADMLRAVEIHKNSSGEDTPEFARTIHRLGALHWIMGNLVEAEKHYHQAIAVYERLFGEDYPDIGTVLVDLASIMSRRRDYAQAEDAYRRSIAIQEKSFGPVNMNIGMALNNLGTLLMELGRLDEAEEILQQAYDVKLQAAGPEYPGLAHPLATSGALYLSLEEPGRAYDAFRRAADIRDKTFTADQFDPLHFISLVWAGRAMQKMNDAEGMHRELEEALALWGRAQGTTNPRVSNSLLLLGQWLVEQRRCEEAVPLLEHTIEIESLLPSPAQERVADAEEGLAACRT